MEAFKTLIWIINIFSSLAIIGLVLMQHGKGADAGASFGGSGSAQGVFGSGGNANFLSRMTGISAIVFFSTCLALGYIHTNTGKSSLNFDDVQQSSPAAASVAATQNDAPAVLTAASSVVTDTSLAAEASKPADAALLAGAAAGAGAAALKANADGSADKAEKTANTGKDKKEDKKAADKKPVEKTKKDKDSVKPKKKVKKSETKK